MFRVSLSSVYRAVVSLPVVPSRLPSPTFKAPIVSPSTILARFFHNTIAACVSLKTKQSAAKRLLRTSKGGIKYGHACKSHLNGSKSRKQIRRLNAKGRLGGVWEKKMSKLLLG